MGCLLAVAGCGNGSAGNGAQENEFPTMEVTTSDVVLSEQYPATIQGRQDIEIRPQVSGTISKVNVKEGQKVIYSKYAGTEVKLDGEEYIIVKQNDILAVVK